MKSAKDLGITNAMGIDVPGGSSSESLSSKAMDIVKEAAADAPAFLKEAQNKVVSTNNKAMAQKSSDVRLSRDARAATKKVAPKEMAPEASDLGDSGFSIGQYLQESSNEVRAVSSSSSARSGMSDTAKENLLYAAGGIFGVSAIVFFLAVQLEIIDVPFMKDVGSVSTPATRRIATDVRNFCSLSHCPQSLATTESDNSAS